MRYRILLLGGYGQFGSRIASVLASDAGLDLVIAGRRLAEAEALAGKLRERGVGAVLSAAAIDIDDDLPAALRHWHPDLVIHAAGPFQQRDYTVAHAVLAGGAHYIDLADGRGFVAGFEAAVATQAREAGRWAITGASSVPGLSASVIEAHRHRFARLDAVETGISPGNRTARGVATTRAILGYVGQPFPVLQNGAWRRVHGWQSLRRIHAADAGTRWLARCEVPDLAVLPQRYPTLRTCEFRAGLELRRMHFGLWLAGWLVRARLLRSLEPWAGPLLRLSRRWQDTGSDVGLMCVDLSGLDHDGRPLRLRWTLFAAEGDGPQVPATAAVVLARKLVRGQLPGSGARACLDLFTLEEFLAGLAGFAVTTSVQHLD